MNIYRSPSHYLLIGLTLLSIAVYALVESSKSPKAQPYLKQKTEATRLASLAQNALKERIVELGIPIDKENDPAETGLIGEQYTLITTDTGVLSAKLASCNIDFAAAFIDMFRKAGVSKGDLVAVGQTGSFPALNISLSCAMAVMELEPIIVTSIGASSWGASNPDFTWLDMESELYQKGLIHYRSKAVSIGGGGDRGRGLSRKGRSLLKEAIKRNSKISESDKKMDFIHESHLSASIDRRLDIYSEMERSRRKSIKVYINIGGGIASLGSSQNGKLIKAGLSRDLTAVEFPAEGVITRMAERGLPIIHILQIRRIANDYGISVMPYLEEEKSKIGKGALYYRETYSLPFTIAAILFLLTVIVLSLRLDVKHYIFQRKKS